MFVSNLCATALDLSRCGLLSISDAVPRARFSQTASRRAQSRQQAGIRNTRCVPKVIRITLISLIERLTRILLKTNVQELAQRVPSGPSIFGSSTGRRVSVQCVDRVCDGLLVCSIESCNGGPLANVSLCGRLRSRLLQKGEGVAGPELFSAKRLP